MRRLVWVPILLLLLTACGATPVASSTTPPPQPSPSIAVASTQAAGPVNAAKLAETPLLPTVSARARQIFQAGVAQGRSPQVFSKVGNCMTASPDYLAPFSTGSANLGDNAALQPTIDYFKAVTIRQIDGKPVDSFSNPSQAAASGFTSAGPLDHLWANPNFCHADESPLTCEYRLSNPSLALILFGTNDVYYLDSAKFEGYMRAMIEESIKEGVLPVLITFPPLPDRLKDSEAYNQIVVNLGAEYDLPVVNLWLSLVNKPGYGVDPQHFTRLTSPADGCAVCFTPTNLDSGIATENLIMLQALDALRRQLSR